MYKNNKKDLNRYRESMERSMDNALQAFQFLDINREEEKRPSSSPPGVLTIPSTIPSTVHSSISSSTAWKIWVANITQKFNSLKTDKAEARDYEMAFLSSLNEVEDSILRQCLEWRKTQLKISIDHGFVTSNLLVLEGVDFTNKVELDAKLPNAIQKGKRMKEYAKKKQEAEGTTYVHRAYTHKSPNSSTPQKKI